MMTFGLIEVFQLLISSQCLLLCIYLLWRKEAKASTRFSLMGLLLNLGIHMVLNLFNDQLTWDPRRILSFLYGPFFYLYVESLVHLSPPFLRNFMILVGLGAAYALGLAWFDAPFHIIAYSIFGSIAVALVASFHLVIKFKRFQNENRSDGLHNTLNWLLILLTLFGLIFLFDISQFFFSQLRPENDWLTIGLFGSLLLFVNVLVIRGLRFPLVFEGIPKQEWPKKVPEIGQISQEDFKEKMLSNKWFEEPDLTLTRLASYLGMHPKSLSQFINRDFNKNFSEFVNDYRLEAAKQKMKDPLSKETISEILFSVGFNAKSTFNAYFKMKVGMTPSQYRRSVRPEKRVQDSE